MNLVKKKAKYTYSDLWENKGKCQLRKSPVL